MANVEQKKKTLVLPNHLNAMCVIKSSLLGKPYYITKNMSTVQKCTSVIFVDFGLLYGKNLNSYHTKKCYIIVLNSSSSLDLHLQRHARHDDRKEDFLRTHGKPQEEKHDEVTNTESVESSNRNGPPKRDVRTICRRCDKVFYDLQAFWTHHKTAHKKKLKCALCNVEFAHKYGMQSLKILFFNKHLLNFRKRLVNHMLSKHKKNDGSYQPLKCDQCDKVFSRTSQLTAHKVVHRPKIHSCHLCSRSFSRP